MPQTPLHLAGFILAASLVAAPAFAEERLSAHLTGAGKDPDGQGHANVRIDAAKSEVCYDLMVENIALATAAHIHKGAAGENGPPVVPLTKPGADGKSSGCATADKAVVEAILAAPGGYYVNVHNAEFPPGAIRGQLAK